MSTLKPSESRNLFLEHITTQTTPQTTNDDIQDTTASGKEDLTCSHSSQIAVNI